jgi:predicted O-methyltransferase YrrM
MAHLRSRQFLALGVVIGALLLTIILVLAGLDAISLVTGAAVVAAAFTVVIGVWLEPARRAQKATRQRERAASRQAKRRAVRQRKVVHGAELRLFSQLEALAWLQSELDLRRPLPPTRGAAAAPDALLELLRILDDTRPEIVLELGSGVSTIVAAARLKAADRGRIVALEHDPGYAAQTRSHLVAQGLERWAQVVDAPLRDVEIEGDGYRWYELNADVPTTIEVLFVDGPPGVTGPLARYPALPLLRERLAPGATLLIDDGSRLDERAMVERWQTEVDGLLVRDLPLAKGAFLITMPS